MVQVVTNFSEFAQEIRNANKRPVTFLVNEKDYELVYSELTSQEEIRSGVEFEKWFKDNYEKIDVRGLNAALAGQWRIWKMIRSNTKGMETFEAFLEIPTTVTAAMLKAIEEDLSKKYPTLIPK